MLVVMISSLPTPQRKDLFMQRLLPSRKVVTSVFFSIYLVMGFTLFAASGLFVSTAQYGTIQKAGEVPVVQKPLPVAVYAISDAQAKAMAVLSGDPTLAAHMLHRVTAPSTVQHTVDYVSTTSSSNWGGYYTHASNITGSYGCFTDTNSPTYDAASWTGVGGVYGNGNLAQTGVDQYYQQAWIETYPNPATFLFSVSVGNKICSEVKLDSSTKKWYLNVTDSTTGTYYANEYSFSPNRSSAEWITEAQPDYSVPKFGSIPFSSTYWYDSSSTQDTATSSKGSLYLVHLYSSSGGSVCPSSESGTSFTNKATTASSC